jgi:hypothetical protein
MATSTLFLLFYRNVHLWKVEAWKMRENINERGKQVGKWLKYKEDVFSLY